MSEIVRHPGGPAEMAIVTDAVAGALEPADRAVTVTLTCSVEEVRLTGSVAPMVAQPFEHGIGAREDRATTLGALKEHVAAPETVAVSRVAPPRTPKELRLAASDAEGAVPSPTVAPAFVDVATTAAMTTIDVTAPRTSLGAARGPG